MQWHITDKCILNCTHCYRGELKDDLPLDGLFVILRRFADFLDEHRIHGRINFGGGEPLLRQHELLTLMREARTLGIECRLLTNGLLVDDTVACELKDAGCATVQVSIDGDRETHERIRGEGTFDSALSGVQCARTAGIDVTISVTASRQNSAELDAVAIVAHELHARLFVSRLVPCGHGAGMRDQMLTATEWLRVMRKCIGWRCNGIRTLFRDPLFAPLFTDRSALWNGCVGGCSIGYHGIAVDSNGDVYPCRRLPIVTGNMLSESLEDVWRASLINELRNRDSLKGYCGKCSFRWICGGCRAIAFAVSDRVLAEDPQCPWHGHIGLTRLWLLKRFIYHQRKRHKNLLL